MYDVPWISAGSVHLARNTPITMLSEITTGDSPSVTSLVGASAAPSHAPAVSPQNIPTFCSVLSRAASMLLIAACGLLPSGAELTRSSAARRDRPPAPRREPRTAGRAEPKLASFSDVHCGRRSTPAPVAVGAQYCGGLASSRK